MKVRTRFILTFLVIVAVTVCSLSYYISTVMMQNATDEKTRSYDMYLHQLVNNVSLLTKETEQAFYNQYTMLNIASIVQSNQLSAPKKANIENTLVSVPLNISNINSVLIEDLEKNRYFATSVLDERPECFDLALQDESIRDIFTVWLRDSEGRLFLKKDLYRLSPLVYSGIILARVDESGFRSSLGFDTATDGITAVYTEQGKLFISNDESNRVSDLFDENMLNYSTPISRQVETEDGPCWMVSRSSDDQKWVAVSLVPMQVVLAAPLALGRIIWLGAFVILGIAVLLSFVITRKLGDKVNRLLSSMDEVSHGRFDMDIDVAGHDEIGQLADRFRWMTGELKTVTEAQVRQATEKQKADYEMLELRYRSLQTQISPHFICNVLTTIDSLALMGKTDEVSKMSICASKYLRDNLRNSDMKFHLLADEVRFVREYVDLYRSLYQNGFEFTVAVDDRVPECLVPTMLLQPLVENALVHGYPLNEPEEGYRIHIAIGMKDGQLQISVSNNGESVGPEIIEMVRRAGNDHEYNKKMKGFGLRSVLQRLYLLYGNRQTLQIESLPGGGTVITMCFPCEPTDPEEAKETGTTE